MNETQKIVITEEIIENVPTRQELGTEIKGEQLTVADLIRKNEDSIKHLDLNILQLLEQGKQVIKPWERSWQLGINYFIRDSHRHEKYQNKMIKPKFSRTENKGEDFMKRYLYGKESETLGNVKLDFDQAKEAASYITIRPKIRLVSVDKDIKVVPPKVEEISFPAKEGIVLTVPKKPDIRIEVVEMQPLAKYPGIWINQDAGTYVKWQYKKGVRFLGNLGQYPMESGTVLKERGKNNIILKDFVSGTAPVDGLEEETSATPVDGPHEDFAPFFMGLCNAPYTYFGEESKIAYFNYLEDYDDKPPLVIEEETEWVIPGNFEKLKAGGYIDEATYATLEKYIDETNFYIDPDTHKIQTNYGELYNVNKGIVEIGGIDTRYFQCTMGGEILQKLNVIENKGQIIGINFSAPGPDGNIIDTTKNAIFLYGMDRNTQDKTVQHIFANNTDGKIELYSNNSYVMIFSGSDDPDHLDNLALGAASFINDGEINLYGQNNIGIFIDNDIIGKINEHSSFVVNRAINVVGDDTTGLYIINSGDGLKHDKNTVRFIAGAKDQSKIAKYEIQNELLKNTPNGVNKKADSNRANDGKEDRTDGFIGVFLDNDKADIKVNLSQIDLEKFARKSVGILAKAGTLTGTEKSNITISGGENNIALFAGGEKGNIVYNGEITIKNSDSTEPGGAAKGVMNLVAYTSLPNKIEINGKIQVDSQDTIGVASEGGNILLNGETSINIKGGKTDNSIGIYAKSNTANPIVIKTDKAQITMDGVSDEGVKTGLGVALYAAKDGKIVANGTAADNGLKITIKDANSAIAVVGENAHIEAKYANIDFYSDSLVFYTDYAANQKIDVENSVINLYGKSVVIKKDVNTSNNPFNFTGTKVNVFSNDAVIMQLSGITELNLSKLKRTLSYYSVGLDHQPGTKDGIKYDKYKFATLEGIDYILDTDLDKSKAVANEDTNDYQFVRRLLVQKSKVNLETDHTVKAILSDADLEKIGDESLIGLEMSSSKTANSNDETQINLKSNTKVIVDKSGTGKGGIGLYINYGKIDVAQDAQIDVEREDAGENEGAIGIYSTNGSFVKNKGTINVGGEKSIGILGTTNRNSKTGTVENELGGIPGENTIDIESSGNINIFGKGGTGIFVKNNKLTNPVASDGKALNTGTITLENEGAIGMFGETAHITNAGKIEVKSHSSTGMVGKKDSIVENRKDIILPDAPSSDKGNIGLYSDDNSLLLNDGGTIKVGNNSYGIFGKNIEIKSGMIEGKNGTIGVYADLEAASIGAVNVKFDSGASMKVGKSSVGFYVNGKHNNVESKGKLELDSNSIGYYVKGEGNKLDIENSSGVNLKNSSIFIYSVDKSGDITNNTPIKSVGNDIYGIYAKGNVVNNGDIDFSHGVGNVGAYAFDGGIVRNGIAGVSSPVISVGETDIRNEKFSIGMIGGYSDDDGNTITTGTVENYGVIKVTNDNTIGMYAAGRGSFAKNFGTIELDGNNTKGIYVIDGAIGENHGTIKTVPNSTATGMVGMEAAKGSYIKNYGEIIIAGTGNSGIYADIESKNNVEKGDIITSDGATEVHINQSDTSKTYIPGMSMNVVKDPVTGNDKIVVNREGKVDIPIVNIDTLGTASSKTVTVGDISIDIKDTPLYGLPSMATASSLGMYIDTSGRDITNPIKGIQNLKHLDVINLVIGVEAADYTGAIDITLGKKIMEPYNEELKEIYKSGLKGEKKIGVQSASLTWAATMTQDEDDNLSITMSKIPYTSFTNKLNVNTYNFLDGMEQRYGVEGLGTREKLLFDKVNGIGKGEPELFAQAVDEMLGRQYVNTAKRVMSSHNSFYREFDDLMNWQTNTKDTMKVKMFGEHNKVVAKKDKAIGYKRDVQGVFVLNNNETVRVGESSGMFLGMANEQFKFKDIGRSKEKAITGQIGYYKSNAYGYNNELNWTWKAGLEGSHRKMDRRYLVVDDIFKAKSKYHSYGVFLDNTLGVNYRLSEHFAVEPYAGLDLAGGRISKIHENSGEMRLDIKAKDYLSVLPNAGVEVRYDTPLETNKLVASVDANVSREFGNIENAQMRARVNRTTADYYELPREKREKIDLGVVGRIGVENESYGVAAKVGYSTVDKALNGGLELRVKF